MAAVRAMINERDQPGPGRHGEGRPRHRRVRHQPLQRRAPAHLGRQLRADELRHRRHHGRAGARPARLRVLPQVRHPGAARHPAGRRRTARRRRDDGSGGTLRHRRELRRVLRPAERGSTAADVRPRRARGLRPGRRHLPPQGLGHLPPALLGHADPRDPLRGLRNRAGAGGRAAGAPAARRQDRGRRRFATGPRAGVRQREVPDLRWSGAPRDRHDGHVHRLVLVLLPLLRRPQRHRAVRFPQDRLLVPDRPVHRRRRARHPAPDLLALLDEDDARPGADLESTSPPRACSRRAW